MSWVTSIEIIPKLYCAIKKLKKNTTNYHIRIGLSIYCESSVIRLSMLLTIVTLVHDTVKKIYKQIN